MVFDDLGGHLGWSRGRLGRYDGYGRSLAIREPFKSENASKMLENHWFLMILGVILAGLGVTLGATMGMVGTSW